MFVGIVLGMAIALAVVSFVMCGLALKEFNTQNAQIETLEMELAESEFIRRILLNKMTPAAFQPRTIIRASKPTWV